jgi:hypothetical protein
MAKRSIAQDKAARVDTDKAYQDQQAQLRKQEVRFRTEEALRKESKTSLSDYSSNPSHEATSDPAPTRHAPTTEGQKTLEKSKYAAAEVWRSPKGDRLTR